MNLISRTCPRPLVVHHDTGRTEAVVYVCPNDDDLARTSAPNIGVPGDLSPAFQASEIPAIQRRVLAALCEVDIERPPVPFVPAGCPVVIHNPFTSHSQVQLLTAVVGTPQILRDILSDYASRRGWRPLVGVQPQPDDRALHLIPAAAEDSLASVVFRNGDQLLPRCLAREMPAADYHSIRLDGRRGRLRLPYHTRRSAHSPLHFRDGECLHADTGPWGPPPPTPAVPSSAYVGASWTPLMLLLAGPRSGWRVPVLAIFALSRAMISDDSRTQATSAVIRVGQYPWRTPADRAAVSATSDGQDFRCILHCPWTGPQGVFQGRASLTVLQLHQRFDAALLADASLVPVWPNPNFYRLNFVPGIRSSSLVCVLVHHDQTVRAVVVPGRISYTDLASAMRFILDTDVNQVRLPPAVHVRRMHAPESLITLRDGDLLDVLAGRPNHLLSVRSASFMKDCVLWTRNFEVINTIAVRLWFPHLQDSLLTWLEPGSRWDAAELTFTGPFRDRYPGRWVPVPWCPGTCPHFVKTPDSPTCVSVLHDSADGVAGLQAVSHITTLELAEILHTMPSQLHVLGRPAATASDVLALRDGDVVWDSLLYEDARSGWPLSHDVSAVASPYWGLCFSLLGRTGLLLSLLLQVGGGATAGVAPGTPSSRGRSRSPMPDRRAPASPRAGRWRPDLDCPMAEVFTGRHCDYRILCPFRGLHSDGYTVQGAPYDALRSAVRIVTGPWASGFTLVGPYLQDEPVLFLPFHLGPFATIIVTAGAHAGQSVSVPSSRMLP